MFLDPLKKNASINASDDMKIAVVFLDSRLSVDHITAAADTLHRPTDDLTELIKCKPKWKHNGESRIESQSRMWNE